MTGYLEDRNAQGDDHDTTHLMTKKDFAFNSDDDFVLVYGVNHTKTGKASHASSVLYERPTFSMFP